MTNAAIDYVAPPAPLVKYIFEIMRVHRASCLTKERGTIMVFRELERRRRDLVSRNILSRRRRYVILLSRLGATTHK